jgi:hypothetical protein
VPGAVHGVFKERVPAVTAGGGGAPPPVNTE